MITGLSIVTVWVLDRDSAKKFYTEQLGFTLTNDIELESGMRWLTVRPPGSENQELLLLDPLHSMLDEESAQHVRALIAKGALSPGVMATSFGMGGRSENSSGLLFITFRMYFGSMCLFTSKVDFRIPSRLSRSSAAQSAR